MSKNKISRFAELKTFSNVIESDITEVFTKNHRLKGKWSDELFRNSQPIILELGCGKGEYTVKLAEKYPDKNFIGIDIKGARMWVGARIALEKELKNVLFLRTKIEFISSFFEDGEIDEIWITFPDPQETRNRRNKRLTSSFFLKKYKSFLKRDGIINLKTDNNKLYNYTFNLAKKNHFKILTWTNDLYQSDHLDKTHEIKTFYEQMFLEEGKPIHYLQFTLEGNENIEEIEE
jgi:tRNA (guanine-N7-)-methyltransferase